MGAVTPAALPGFVMGRPSRPGMTADEAIDALEHMCTVDFR